jgi:hypothetical protein
VASSRRYIFCALILLFAALLLAPAARADTVYIYSGSALTSTIGTCPSPCAVTVMLQYATPLPGNASDPNGFPPPYLGPPYYPSHDCSIGPACAIITGSGVVVSNVPSIGIFETGPDGLPTRWLIIGDNGSQYVLMSTQSGDSILCEMNCNSADTSPYSASNQDNPGSWSVSVTPVPEPSSLVLLGSGAFVVIVRMRRRLLG